jgi:hypothetical protein
VLAIVLLTGGGSGAPRHRGPRTVRLPALIAPYANRAMGATGELPAGWSAVKSRGLLRMADTSGRAVILVAAVDGVGRQALLSRTLAAIRHTYRDTRVKAAAGTKLAGLPAASVAVYGDNARGVPLRILLAAAQAKGRSYVLEAFTARSATRTELVEAQEVIDALRLTGH